MRLIGSPEGYPTIDFLHIQPQTTTFDHTQLKGKEMLKLLHDNKLKGKEMRLLLHYDKQLPVY